MPIEPLITGLIPKRNFELVRDAISMVLKLELDNQKVLTNFNEEIKYFVERYTPIQNDEKVVVNVSLDGNVPSNKTQKSTSNEVKYFIDVYCTGKASNEKGGHKDSKFRLHKFLGMIMYILSYSEYKTLTLPLGIIGSSNITSFKVAAPDTEDASFFSVGRIIFAVDVYENQSLVQGIPLDSVLSKFKLELTELGYELQKIELNNQ